MRISDWSSDVCSSDLVEFIPDARSLLVVADIHRRDIARVHIVERDGARRLQVEIESDLRPDINFALQARRADGRHELAQATRKIGRASCRERVCQYV